MNTLSHLQIGWLVGHARPFDKADRRKLMLASLAPDLDGIFFWNAKLFHQVHHTFGHNIFTGLVVGGVLAAISKKGERVKWFALGYAMVALQMLADFITCPAYVLRFFWPLSNTEYYLPRVLGVSVAAEPQWDFALTYIVQILVMILLLYATVVIYIRHKRTFIEVVSAKLDKFVTDFIVLPFRFKCDTPECKNRAHYTCGDTGAVRCIEHCKINGDLTISCAAAAGNKSEKK